MHPPHPAAGFSLLETLVALFLTTVAVLGAAPLFLQAGHATDAGADLGTIGAFALDRMEQLRSASFSSLVVGGSLTEDVAGHFDHPEPFYVVRWTIENLGSPSKTKRIVVVATAEGDQVGSRRRVELTFLRGL